METRVTQIGSSVGIIIPKYVASEGGFSKGTPISIQYKNNTIIISKQQHKRQGWANAFAQYAKEGEEDILLPDILDSEALDLL
ncbi:MAG: AbrB/MazE/SpoVT family DNA-binding domain-containing protein [Bacteroides sp.]|nr:AbrB/MazE/SpoVT family DNA-binding domain-containing protein [Bacteroides sp.]MCM1379624.1 AbrB/MazE/SpoVT family DNA-binding domain-containing protein [Bacteroides sp.]MCM1445994.1 AbrB/MazE/SpoVT family DNA-binding domain-containing protein [Prevotella sp.]